VVSKTVARVCAPKADGAVNFPNANIRSFRSARRGASGIRCGVVGWCCPYLFHQPSLQFRRVLVYVMARATSMFRAKPRCRDILRGTEDRTRQWRQQVSPACGMESSDPGAVVEEGAPCRAGPGRRRQSLPQRASNRCHRVRVRFVSRGRDDLNWWVMLCCAVLAVVDDASRREALFGKSWMLPGAE
jgi:hypothetical protein